MSRTARHLTVGLLLATSMIPALAGCGAGPGTAAVPGQSQPAAKAKRPAIPTFDRSELSKAKSGISASSYWTVDRARRSASNALYRYQDLREDWERAWSDHEKDRIEQRMLSVLTGSASDIRSMTSGSWDYDDRQLNHIANSVLDEYEYLRQQWLNEHDINRQREIVNDMLVTLTRGLQQVQNYYSRGR